MKMFRVTISLKRKKFFLDLTGLIASLFFCVDVSGKVLKTNCAHEAKNLVYSGPTEEELSRQTPIVWSERDFSIVSKKIQPIAASFVFAKRNILAFEAEDLESIALFEVVKVSQKRGKTWQDVYNQIYSLTRNKFLSLVRSESYRRDGGSRWRRGFRFVELESVEGLPIRDGLASQPSLDGLDSAEYSEIYSVLKPHLSIQENFVFLSLYFEELTGKEVAKLLGVSPARVSHINNKILTLARVMLTPGNY